MYHHLHQVPPPNHGHINAPIQNCRKPLLDCGKTKLGRKCIAIIIPLAVISAILYFGFKFLSGPGDLGHTASGADDFSPYTSLVFPISGLYCDSYRMTKYSGSSVGSLSWNTSLYILKTLPTLSSGYNFSIQPEGPTMITLKPGEFYQWSFILHGGSRYVVNSCALGEGDDAKLMVIKGEALFREWVVRRQCSGCVKYDLPPCNLNATEQSPMYDILMNDEYYFVYFNPTHHPAHVQVEMAFTKLEYSFDQSDIYCQCTCTMDDEYAEYYACSSCDLSLTFSGYLLLRTMPASDYIDINWEDKLYVTWSCDASYNYAYLLLFCLPLMVIVVIVLVCSDVIMPCLSKCRHKNSDANIAANAEQPALLRCSKKVLFAALWFLLVLFISLVSVCIVVAGLTSILAVISFISKGIPAFIDSKLKLSLLALSIVLFIVSILCGKFKQWVQNKVRSVAKVMRLSRTGQNHQTRNTDDANTSALRSDNIAHLRNQILRVLCVCVLVPVVIISIVCMSAMFTFLEAFFPVLSTYSSETDSGIFIPGDTQIFSFNSFFCSGYSISTYGSPHLSATLSIVNSESVAGNHSVTHMISNDFVSAANFSATWNFFLNEKSGASIRACLFEDDLTETTTLDLYEYNSFGTTLLRAYNLTDYSCHGDLWRLPIGNISGKAGKYLILLFTESFDPVQVHVEIELNRFLYFVPQNVAISSAQTCSVNSHTSDTCTAVAPSSAGSMIGIISAYSDQSPINWHETISITKTCHYHMATWTALWLPVLLINVAIFSVVCGAIQVIQFKQIRKKLKQEEASGTDSEPLIHSEANDNNDETNAVTATVSDSANANQASEQSDPEPAHEVVGVEVECTSDRNAISTEPLDPMGIVVQVEHPPTGDTSAGQMSEPDSTESALKYEPSSAKASIRPISDSRDASKIVEHNTVDTRLIIDTEVEDTSVSYKPEA